MEKEKKNNIEQKRMQLTTIMCTEPHFHYKKKSTIQG